MKRPRVEWNRVLNWRVFPWVLAVVLLGTTLANYWLLRNERNEDAQVEEIQDTASDFLFALTNFSAKTIDEDVKRLQGYAVGQFADEVEETFSPERIQQIKQAKVESVGEVRTVFVEDVNGESATVFGVVNETVTNAASQAPRTDVLRVELEMVETIDGWKVSQVNILQTSGGTLPAGTA